MNYNGIEEEQNTGQKYYTYTKGTDYYLANRYGNLKPITVDITYDGNEFTFIPDYVITESDAGSNTAKITDRSLLSGVTKLMAMITSFCGIRSMFNKDKKDQQFIIKQDYSKCDITLYIDYTNNMIFPDDEPDKYKLLKNYIFPSSRIPSYSSGFAKITLPKDLIKIEYSTNLGYIKRDGLLYDKVKLYKKFLEVFKDKDLSNTLSELEIKEQIDIPTKLIIYGVCDKFGKYKGYEGICAILYIEHKITLDDYLKFKKICDEKLNEYLVPLNLTADDIKKMTSEKVRKEFNTFQKIENLAIRCGWLADPRGYRNNSVIYNYYLYNERTSYSNDAGLSRWNAIKKYYPELYNGLKIILDYYLEVKDEYDTNFQKEYDVKFNIAANDAYNNIINSNDDITDKNTILKYIINYINSLKDDIKLYDYEDLKDFFIVLNQNILDIVNEIYTNQYRQRVKDYKIAHPKAKQMELIFDNNIFVSDSTVSNYNGIFKYEPFKYEYLQKEIQKVLDQPELKTVKNILNNFNLTFTVKSYFLINNKILDYRRTANNYKKYTVNINDAINSLEVAYTTPTNPSWGVFNNIEFMKQIINVMLMLPISLKVKWFKHDYSTKFNLADPTINYMPDSISWYSNVYNSEMSADDLINKLIKNDKDIKDYLDFRIIFEYDNPQLIADNLKSILKDAK